MRSLKTKCCDLRRSLKRRLTQQITGIRILITYHHREIKGIWHDPKYRLLLWLSRDQLKAATGWCQGDGGTDGLQVPHPPAPLTGEAQVREAETPPRRQSLLVFLLYVCVSSKLSMK